jgi:hypothetical protein
MVGRTTPVEREITERREGIFCEGPISYAQGFKQGLERLWKLLWAFAWMDTGVCDLFRPDRGLFYFGALSIGSQYFKPSQAGRGIFSNTRRFIFPSSSSGCNPCSSK